MRTKLLGLLVVLLLTVVCFGMLQTVSADTEPNDTQVQAETISAGSAINGELNGTDRDDWYKISIPGGKKVTISFTSDSPDNMKLWFGDVDEVVIFELESKNSIEKTDETHFEIGRDSADYIIRVYMYWASDVAGTYSFEVTLEDQNDAGSGSDVGETISDSYVILPDTEYSGLIMDYDRKDVYKMSIPEGKKVTMHLTSDTTDADMHFGWLDDVGDEILSFTGKNSVEVTKEHYLAYENSEQYYYFEVYLYWASDIGATYKIQIDLEDQNDAGSGQDAPAELNGAIEIVSEVEYEGFQLDWDEVDIYKINVDKNTNLTLYLTADVEDDMTLELLDIEGDPLTDLTSKNSIENSQVFEVGSELRLGFFYISIYQYWASDIGGSYTFKVESSVPLAGSTEPVDDDTTDDDIVDDDVIDDDIVPDDDIIPEIPPVEIRIDDVDISVDADVEIEVEEIETTDVEKLLKDRSYGDQVEKQNLKDLEILFEINPKNDSEEAKVINIEIDISDKLGDIDPEKIKLYWLDEEEGEWVVIEGSEVDEDGTLTAEIDHLTIFAAYAEESKKEEKSPGFGIIAVILASFAALVIISRKK